MWNYSFTLPSAMILLILVIFYFRRPRMPIRMNVTFLSLLVIDISTLAVDYASSRVDELYMNYPAAVCYALNLLFFVLFLARIYWFFLYTLDVLENHCTYPRWIRRLSPLVFAIAEVIALSSPLTHAVFFIDGSGYHSGPLYNILYVCFFFYLIAAAVLILYSATQLHREVCNGLLGVIVILLLGNIVRMLFPTLLVMNTFCLMAILIIYLAFENPDLFLSDRGSAFNMRAFRFVLREWGPKGHYHLLSFIIRDYSELREIYGGVQIDEGIHQISLFLTEQYPKCLVFYLRNGSFALIVPKSIDTRPMIDAITARFENPWMSGEMELVMRPSFVEMELGLHVDHVIGMLLLALESAAEDEQAVSIQAIDQYLANRQALEAALKNESLEVFLQPLIDSRTGQLVAAEALSRIRGEDGRLIPPTVFIPIAEKDGSIVALGELVMRKICRFVRENDIRAMGMQWINVNLSPYQCMSRDLPQRFKSVLEEYAVPAELIHLELTEQSIVDYALLEHQLLALQDIGFQFALDDYGSGFSNLTRVTSFPFKNIKIDMEVVWNYFNNRGPLLPTIVGVFKQMNFSITAEGIETEEMSEAMAEIGCDYLQGYFFSRPVPIPEFVEMYSKEQGVSLKT